MAKSMQNTARAALKLLELSATKYEAVSDAQEQLKTVLD